MMILIYLGDYLELNASGDTLNKDRNLIVFKGGALGPVTTRDESFGDCLHRKKKTICFLDTLDVMELLTRVFVLT